MDHLAPAPFGGDFENTTRTKRKTNESSMSTPPVKKTKIPSPTKIQSPFEKLVEELRDGAAKGREKGWYLKKIREKAGFTGKEEQRLSHEESQRLWTEAQLLESHRGSISGAKQKKGKNGKFSKTSATSKALTTTYLVETAYGRGKMFLQRLKKKATIDGSLSAVLPKKTAKSAEDIGQCVIENRALARSKYTAKYFYAVNFCRDALANNASQSWECHQQRYNAETAAYDGLDDDTKKNWEMEARTHDELQPTIKHRIVEELKRNPKISWASLEKRINHWCSATTIWRWVTLHAGYKCYSDQSKRRQHLSRRWRKHPHRSHSALRTDSK